MDLSNLSLEELWALQKKVETEIMWREHKEQNLNEPNLDEAPEDFVFDRDFVRI